MHENLGYLRQRFQHFCFYLVSEPVSFAHRELTIHDDVKVYADSAPDPSLESTIRAIAANQRGIIGLDKCHVRKMGLSFYVDLHIVVNGQLSVREGHQLAHKPCLKYPCRWNRRRS